MRVFDRGRRGRGVVTATRGEVAEGHRSRWLPRLCTDRAWTGLNERCSMTKCQILKGAFCNPTRNRGPAQQPLRGFLLLACRRSVRDLDRQESTIALKSRLRSAHTYIVQIPSQTRPPQKVSFEKCANIGET